MLGAGLWALSPCVGPEPLWAASETGIRVYRTTEEALALAFPAADRFGSEEISITEELRAALEDRLKRPFPFRDVRIHHAYVGEDELGRAVVTEEIGKYRPMTFLVAIDGEGVVQRVDLLRFREAHGYQVEKRSFMRQYEGLTREDPIRVGKDIDAISGATLSARGISKGLKRMLYFFEVIDGFETEAHTDAAATTEANPSGP